MALGSGNVGLGWRHVAFGAPLGQVTPMGAETVQFEVAGIQVATAFSIITMIIMMYYGVL